MSRVRPIASADLLNTGEPNFHPLIVDARVRQMSRKQGYTSTAEGLLEPRPPYMPFALVEGQPLAGNRCSLYHGKGADAIWQPASAKALEDLCPGEWNLVS